MANPELSVEITAKIDGLRDAFNKAIRETSNFNSKTRQELSAVDKGFASLANDVDVAMTRTASAAKKGSNEISKSLAQAAQISSTSGNAISAGSNKAAYALNNLGRVAQDAPFGFIGIQNNLNPLLESFQALKVETGSASGAFKALAGSLVGAGGLGLALSVVSSLFLVYQQYSQKAAKADEERIKNTKSAKEALDLYIASLDASTRAQINGEVNAQKELVSLKLLYDASQNLKLPLSERIKAAQALQDQYPKTFENFTDEQIALGKAGAAYRALAVDIIAVAKAAARTDILTENEKEIVQLNQKSKILDKQLKTQKEIDERSKLTAKTITVTGGGVLGTTNSTADLEKAANQTSKTLQIQQQLKEIGNQVAIKRRESLGIESEITAELVKQQSVVSITGLEDDDKKKNKEKSLKEYKSLSEILNVLNTELKVNEGQLDLTFNEKRIKDLDSYQKAIDELTKNGFAPQGAEIAKLAAQYDKLAIAIRGTQLAPLNPNAPKDTGSKLPQGIGERQLVFQAPKVDLSSDLSRYTDNIIENIDKLGSLPNIVTTIGTALGNSFVAMGEAIASGGDALGAAGDVLKSLVAGIMASLGQQLITLGAAKVAAGILATPFGGKLVAQGVGLIAIGSALSLAGGLVTGSGKGGNKKENTPNKRNIPGFANGVTNYSGGIAMVGEEGPELVRLPSGSDVIPNRQSMAMLNGANRSVNVTGEFRLSGRDLVAVIEEVNALRKRSR